MICQRCLRRFARREAVVHSRRAFSIISPSRTPATATVETSNTPGNATIANSPAVVPTPSASAQQDVSPQRRREKSTSAQRRGPSSVPAGTVLKGLNFMKNKPDPVAMEDSEYPDWLWTVLDTKDDGKSGAAESEGDMFSKSKKQRRLAAKAQRRQRLELEHMGPKVPLEEQTLDLPAGDGTLEGARQADAARGELNKAMRVKRRKDIKEANFLKTMS